MFSNWLQKLDRLFFPRYRVFIALFLASVVLYSLGVYRVKSVLWGDSRYYFAYTHSLALDHDLLFDNEAYLPDVGFPNPPQVSAQTHRITNKFSPGVSIMWIPGFLIGQLFTQVLSLLGLPVRMDGYGFFTLYLTAIWALSFSVVGLFLVYKTIQERWNDRVGLLVSASLFLATQLFYYTAIDPLNSHSATFLLSALLLYGSHRFLEGNRSLKLLLGMGLAGGLLSLTRNQDVVMMVPIGVLFLFSEGSLRARLTRAVTFGLSWLVVVVLQPLSTFFLYGQFTSPYLIGGEKINWLQPNFWRVLFSQSDGLFYFAPLCVFCLVGLFLASKKRLTLAQVGLSIFLLELYVIACWTSEVIGGPYGSRKYVSSLPWLAIGLAYLVNLPQCKRLSWWKIGGILGVFTANNLIQTLLMLLNH